jgi:signal transduction histidine kinase
MVITLYCVFWVKIRERILSVIFKYKQKIVKNERNLKNILETLPDGLAVLNLGMKVKLYNKSLKEIFEVPSKQEFIEIFQKLKYIEGSRYYNEGSESYIYQDVINYCESSNRQPASFGITQINSKFYQWKGNISSWNNSPSLILLVRDCTAIIDLEKAKAKQIYQTAMLRSVSHELKTPTSAIISVTEQLMGDFETAPEYKEKLNVINSSGGLLLNLINSLLDYILINSNTFVLNKYRISLKHILEDVTSMFNVQARQKKLRLITQLSPDVPLYIFNDGQRLKQVIINILSNAIKYTLRGCILIRMKIKEEKLKIYIQDTGIGITQQVLSNLFHLFGSQHDLSSTAHGCGLKLHISNLLVEQLGGDHIYVKSIEGRGTCFSFFVDTGFDRIQTSDSTLENIPFIYIPASYTIPSFHSEIPLILIVDDNEFNRYVIGEFLKKERIVFDEAINGLEAVRMIKQRNLTSRGYKVVIMDCQMPVMDGWEATKRVVEMMKEGMIKLLPAVIGYTAYSGSDEEMKSREAGMIDFIEKPCPRDRLMGTIKQYLE